MVTIQWDSGTAYDLFASLSVLHHPVTFGVRPAWAAGVRSRLPAVHRDFLEKIFSFVTVPLPWLFHLNVQPKNARAVINALEELPPGERLTAISYSAELSREAGPTLESIRKRGSVDVGELETLRAIYLRHRVTPWPGMFQRMGEAWSNPEEFGERLLPALKTYCQVFFFEEEERIEPVLQSSLLAAHELAGRVSITELIETLSRGLQLDSLTHGVVLAPSFWAGPLVFVNKIEADRYIVAFGGRPATQPLVPGEDIPASLLISLKAMADPTRLRILRYLASRPLTLTELSRLLRLRLPTVLHHLNALRLAELVQITFIEDGERRYALRHEVLETAFHRLTDFLEGVSFSGDDHLLH